MKQLKNGYLLVTEERKDGDYPTLAGHLVTAGNPDPDGLRETLCRFDFNNWDQVRETAGKLMKATSGKAIIIVDNTRLNLAKETVYYRLSADGKLKQFTPTEEGVALAGLDAESE